MNFAAIICSRFDSERMPNKPFLRVNGQCILDHLISRVIDSGLTTFLAVPDAQLYKFQDKIKKRPDLRIVSGPKDDPLKRMLDVAEKNKVDHIVRICHDKVFIDYRQINWFIEQYKDKNLEYIYSTNFIDGMAFEIFSTKALRRAHLLFKNVEHISFAIDAVTERKMNARFFPKSIDWLERIKPGKRIRLLIDYPCDFENIQKVFKRCGSFALIDDIVEHCGSDNILPKVSVYTCCYNDAEHLEECIKSVLDQNFESFEYILLDDGSTNPDVFAIMSKYANNPNVKIVRNERNLGLASSSNIAVKKARGKYAIRLDADDYFISNDCIARLYDRITNLYVDAVYPHNVKNGAVIDGRKDHHVGGAIFRKRALDYLKFTDGLKHFDGLDLYNRATMLKLKIAYFFDPIFVYRQRPNSLSNTKSEIREEIKTRLDCGIVGRDLIDET